MVMTLGLCEKWPVMLNPSNFQAYERVVVSAFHSMLVVEFSCTSFEVKWDMFGDLKTWEISYFEGGEARITSCDSIDGNNSIVEHLHEISCQKCANHSKLATLPLWYVNPNFSLP